MWGIQGVGQGGAGQGRSGGAGWGRAKEGRALPSMAGCTCSLKTVNQQWHDRALRSSKTAMGLGQGQTGQDCKAGAEQQQAQGRAEQSKVGLLWSRQQQNSNKLWTAHTGQDGRAVAQQQQP